MQVAIALWLDWPSTRLSNCSFHKRATFRFFSLQVAGCKRVTLSSLFESTSKGLGSDIRKNVRCHARSLLDLQLGNVHAVHVRITNLFPTIRALDIRNVVARV